MASLVTVDSPLPGTRPRPAAPFPLPLKVFISYKQSDFAAVDTSGGLGTGWASGLGRWTACVESVDVAYALVV